MKVLSSSVSRHVKPGKHDSMNHYLRTLVALVMLAPLTQAASAKDVDSEAVARMLQQADTAISGKRFGDAVRSCQAGLNVLGEAYHIADVEDDTAQKLIAAQILLQEGKVEHAAALFCRMLAGRFEQLKVKQRSDPAGEPPGGRR
jgi:triphosphoribosyl-dephospho-CoA synthetase